MKNVNYQARLSSRVCALATALFGAMGAQAAQFVPARDGDSTMVKISIKDDTRIKVVGAKIIDVTGDVYHEEKNPRGRIIVEKDPDDGEINVLPTSVALEKNPPQQIKVTLKTAKGKYTLLLNPVDMPGDTVIVEPKGPAINQAKGARQPTQVVPTSVPEVLAAPQRGAGHIRKLKAFVLAMVSKQDVPDLDVLPVGEEVALWKEAKFVHEDKWMGDEWVGDRYTLINVSGAELVMDEREFYRAGVVGVSIRMHELKAGESTEVYIIRQRLSGE
jgi:conjugal transfer pilus assembly protein TraK